MNKQKVKLNKWYLFLTQLLNVWNWIVATVKSNFFHVFTIVFLVVFAMVVGFLFKYGEIKSELAWNHYLTVTKAEVKQQEIEKKVKFIMSLYKSDSLEIFESIMNTFDPVLMSVLIGIESQYNPNAVSPMGALGLTQCLPDKFKKGDNWKDSKINIQRGEEYLKLMIKQFDGDRNLALAGYNAGPGAVIKAGYTVPLNTKNNETGLYVKKANKMFGLISEVQ